MSFALALMITLAVETPVEQECGQNNQSKTLAQQIINHPEQNRETLTCNTLLSKIAQLKAKEIVTSSTQSSLTPNELLIKNGYRVPNYYPVHGNQVEAVAKGSEPLNYLLKSDKHKNHVLGLGDFFSIQSEIGVGVYKDNDPSTPDQWVVLIAQPWQVPKIKYKMTLTQPINIKDVCPSGWEKSADHMLKRQCEKLAEEAKN